MYQVQGREYEDKNKDHVSIKPGFIAQGNSHAKGRSKWQRPQLMVWSHNEGVIGESENVKGNTYPWGREGEDFIITSDHNRSALSVDQLRIENRMRMVGGNMRSYYTGQKVTINCSWNLLPSRAYQSKVYVEATPPNPQTQEKDYYIRPDTTPYSQEPFLSDPISEYTADGGAGGADLLTWYRETHGPFWVFLSYDNWPNFSDETADGEQNTELWDQWKMYKYSDRYMMYFTSFNYSVEKRGLYDMWNVSVSLEEA